MDFSGSGSLVADMLKRFYLQTPKIRKDQKYCIRTLISEKSILFDQKKIFDFCFINQKLKKSLFCVMDLPMGGSLPGGRSDRAHL